MDFFVKDMVKRRFSDPGFTLAKGVEGVTGDYTVLTRNSRRLVGDYLEWSHGRIAELLEAHEVCIQFRDRFRADGNINGLRQVDSYGAHIQRTLQIIQEERPGTLEAGLEILRGKSMSSYPAAERTGERNRLYADVLFG